MALSRGVRKPQLFKAMDSDEFFGQYHALDTAINQMPDSVLVIGQHVEETKPRVDQRLAVGVACLLHIVVGILIELIPPC